MKKRLNIIQIVIIVVFLLIPVLGFSQLDQVNDALNDTANNLDQTKGGITNLVTKISGLIATAGAATVGYHYFMGSQETNKKIIQWGGGIVVFFGLIALISKVF